MVSYVIQAVYSVQIPKLDMSRLRTAVERVKEESLMELHNEFRRRVLGMRDGEAAILSNGKV